MSSVNEKRRAALSKLDAEAYQELKDAEDAVWEEAERQARRAGTPSDLQRKYPSLGNRR